MDGWKAEEYCIVLKEREQRLHLLFISINEEKIIDSIDNTLRLLAIFIFYAKISFV